MTTNQENDVTDNKLTTAAYLGQYRTELLDAGIPEHEVNGMVRDVARQIAMDQGVTVRQPDAGTSDAEKALVDLMAAYRALQKLLVVVAESKDRPRHNYRCGCLKCAYIPARDDR